MRLQLLISERRPELRAMWTEVFRGIEGVTLLDTNAGTLMALPEVDAELMLGVFAHERYGGRPKHGESQILSTQGEPEMPPWVVTTAPFSAHLESGHQEDGMAETVIVQNRQLPPEEEACIVFTQAFERIKAFNQGSVEPKIRTLGFDLGFLNSPQGEPGKEAEAVRRAYLEQYGDVDL